MSHWYDPWGVASEVYHAATGAPTADEKRNQAKAVSDQVKAYQEQTQITRDELSQKKNEVQAQKRRVDEKQIRFLRRNYRPQGFLGSQQSSEPDMSSKLGG